jgi:hypothetical protein
MFNTLIINKCISFYILMNMFKRASNNKICRLLLALYDVRQTEHTSVKPKRLKVSNAKVVYEDMWGIRVKFHALLI